MTRYACFLILLLVVSAFPLSLGAGARTGQVQTQAADQEPQPVTTANYDLAGRFAPYKIDRLIYSTAVRPRWIDDGSDRFWYEWETSGGKIYYLVDPARGTKTAMFDNDRIAAELTRLTKDPWDGQHLPIRGITFIDADTLQFEVESSQDAETEESETDETDQEQQQEEEDGETREERTKKHLFHFEYDINGRTLRILEDWEKPDDHPNWANVSPDGQTVIFDRNDNLFMMSGDSYQQILDARRGKDGDDADEADQAVEVEEIQLTTDGEQHYSYANFDRGDTDPEREKTKDERKRVTISWSHESGRFAIVRRDQRQTEDLWVIHSVGNRRPELETYRYDMAGEENITQRDLGVYDLATRQMVAVDAAKFKDQNIALLNARKFVYPDRHELNRNRWLSDDSNEVYFWRQSRDRHRLEVCVADATTGEVRVVLEEELNTYVEIQPLERLSSGDLIWWSERGRLVASLSLRLGRDPQDSVDRRTLGRETGPGDRRRGRGRLLHRERSRDRRRPVLPASVQREPRWGRPEVTRCRRLRPSSPDGGVGPVLCRQLLEGEHDAERNADRGRRRQGARSRSGRLQSARGGGVSVP